MKIDFELLWVKLAGVVVLLTLASTPAYAQYNADRLRGKPLCSATRTTNCVPSTDAAGAYVPVVGTGSVSPAGVTGARICTISSSSATAYVGATSPAMSTYPAGVEVRFTANQTSGAAPTLNCGGGAMAIRDALASAAIPTGFMESGYVYTVRSNGTYWLMQEPAPGATGQKFLSNVSVTTMASAPNIVKSIIEYGAKCDGVTDDKTALLAAAAGTSPGLAFPSLATCLTSGTVTFTRPVKIYGNGARLHSTNAAGAATLAFNGEAITNKMNGAGIYDLTITGGTGSGDALWLKHVMRSVFTNVKVPGTGGAGLRCIGCIVNTYDNFTVSTNLISSLGLSGVANPTDGVILTGADGQDSIGNNFITPVFETAGTCLKVEGTAKNNTFLGGTIEGCTSVGAVLGVNTFRTAFVNVDWESNGVDVEDNTATKDTLYYYDGEFGVGTFPAGAAVSGRIRSNTFAMRRIAHIGTPIVAGDIVLDAKWGDAAAVSDVTGTDAAFEFTATANGTGITSFAGATLTFKDGTWGTAPLCITKMSAGTGATANVLDTITATTVRMVYGGTVSAGNWYRFVGFCVGR